MSNRLSGGMVRYGLPGVFLGVALAWLAGDRSSPAVAQGWAGNDLGAQSASSSRGLETGRAGQGQVRTASQAEANGTMALVTSPAGSTQWLYLIDTKSRAFAVYRFDSGNSKGSVKLEAARQYQWDLKLEHYNNQAPEPAAIESMVKTLAQPVSR